MSFALEARANPVQLWAQVRHFFGCMIATYGDAAALAVIDELAHATRRKLLEWLAPLETLARKLLLIEASKLTLPPLSTHKRRRRETNDSAGAPNLEHPNSWRVCFYMPIPPDERGAVPDDRAPRIRLLGPSWPPRPVFVAPAAKPASSAPRPKTPPTWRLARRIEALRRTLENPTPHARRLARRLSRIPRYARAERARRIASTTQPRHARDLERLLRDAATLASGAAEYVCNSS